MKDYIKFMDNLPIILKIILAFPLLDGIFYGIYRIAKGHLLLGIIWIIFGEAIGWLIDIISLVLNNGKIKYFI